MSDKLSCPSCEYGKISTTWVDHEFQYGTDEDHVMLKCSVPRRTCPVCNEQWLDHIAEDIMAEVVSLHLSPVVIDTYWIIEATLAAKRADAYSVHQVVCFMEGFKVPIEEMDEWCAQGREDYPCLFMNHVVSGIGKGQGHELSIM